VEIEAVKPAEDGEDVIIRLYEPRGTSSSVVLKSRRPWPLLQEVDLLEENGKPVPRSKGKAAEPFGSQVALTFGPYQIRTLRARFA
ncbi:MAG: hypothetical protein E4H09_02415, partial [Spirochaetales bacterium]